jgi:hypothetical protein
VGEQEAKRSARRWLAVVVAIWILDLALFLTGADFFHPMLYLAMFTCMALGAHRRGMAEGLRRRREGICGDEMPRPLLLGPGISQVCGLTHGHRSDWHEVANVLGEPTRWKHRSEGKGE